MYIKLRIITNSKKEIINKISNDHYQINVKEKAERNMANTRIIEIMSDVLKISKKSIKIISGHHSPSKIISVNIPE